MGRKIAVIDYGMGNLRSVSKAIEHVVEPGDSVLVTSEPAKILGADRVVFPGQGAARDCMDAISEHRLNRAVLDAAHSKPFLGICMGLQVLMETSEENGGTRLLGLIPGQVRRFPADMAVEGQRLKIPQMGWNRVRQTQSHPLWEGIPDGSRFYFVHSFYIDPQEGDLVAGTGGYEIDGYSYRNSGHASAVRDACAGCHMGQPERIHDGYMIGGHSFNMIDEDTGSDLAILCENCHSDIDEYDYTADMDYDFDGEVEGYQTEVDGLLDSLAVLLIAEGVMNDSHRPISGITIADGNVMGSLHNYGIVEEDRSHGIHNFKYIVDLLQNSIDYLTQ